MVNSSELCTDQLQHFATFGYIILRQLLTPEDLKILAVELDQGLDAQFPHNPFDGSQRHWSRMTDETTPFFRLIDGRCSVLDPSTTDLWRRCTWNRHRCEPLHR